MLPMEQSTNRSMLPIDQPMNLVTNESSYQWSMLPMDLSTDESSYQWSMLSMNLSSNGSILSLNLVINEFS